MDVYTVREKYAIFYNCTLAVPCTGPLCYLWGRVQRCGETSRGGRHVRIT
jgi:hypothetical protein